jgi:hypothetical protein
MAIKLHHATMTSTPARLARATTPEGAYYAARRLADALPPRAAVALWYAATRRAERVDDGSAARDADARRAWAVVGGIEEIAEKY